MAKDSEFDELVEGSGQRLIRTGWLLTGSWQAGEDLAQETLIRLFRAWARLHDPDASWAYAHRTMVRLHLRRAGRAWNRELSGRTLPEDAYQDEPGPDIDLMAALRRLPARQRTTVVLRYFLDQSVGRTAADMKCTEGTVKSQAARALKTLRDELEASEEISHGVS